MQTKNKFIMDPIIDKRIFDWMVSFRRELHMFPELSWEEEKTATRIENQLNQWRIDNFRMSGTGVIADLPGPEGVKKVAIRADIDALPINEETGLPFASQRDGIMHACGHDGHASMLMGAARLLSKKKVLPAPVRLIFQPAEEKGSGAKALIEDGVLEDVAVVFGGHIDRHYPIGKLIVTPGPVNASIDAFRIDIKGPEGHAGRPHETVDAIFVGSQIVTALQSIVSREVDPGHAAVVTVGKFNSGISRNAVAGNAVLEGTTRAHNQSVRKHIEESIRRITKRIGETFMAKTTVKFKHGPPVLLNHKSTTRLARNAAIELVGEENVASLEIANLGAEDFSYYVQEIPGCYVRFGAGFKDSEGFPSHSSRFDFNENGMAYGAAWMCKVAILAGEELRRSMDKENLAVV